MLPRLFTPNGGTMVMGATLLSLGLWAAPAPSGRPQKLASPDAVSGRRYTLERTPAVTGPWSTLATPTAPPGGLIEYVDTNLPLVTAFYRTSTQRSLAKNSSTFPVTFAGERLRKKVNRKTN